MRRTGDWSVRSLKRFSIAFALEIVHELTHATHNEKGSHGDTEKHGEAQLAGLCVLGVSVRR